jgi:hypothetical protein
MRVAISIDKKTFIEIPNFDVHNAVLPSVGDCCESPSQDDIDFRVKSGYMVVTGELHPDRLYKVVSRVFYKMDSREVFLKMESL